MRWNELKVAGIEHNALRDLVREGSVLYPATGIFAPVNEYEPLRFSVSVLATHGAEFFLCLESAARFHGLLPETDNLLWVVLPDNRDTLRSVSGYAPVPVRWNRIRIPRESVPLSDEQRAAAGYVDGMSEMEVTERHFGVIREQVYGATVKVTSPARTICDLLMFQERRINFESVAGLTIPQNAAFAAVNAYREQFDLAEARVLAERLGYSEYVSRQLALVEHLSTCSGFRLQTGANNRVLSS